MTLSHSSTVLTNQGPSDRLLRLQPLCYRLDSKKSGNYSAQKYTHTKHLVDFNKVLLTNPKKTYNCALVGLCVKYYTGCTRQNMMKNQGEVSAWISK